MPQRWPCPTAVTEEAFHWNVSRLFCFLLMHWPVVSCVYGAPRVSLWSTPKQPLPKLGCFNLWIPSNWASGAETVNSCLLCRKMLTFYLTLFLVHLLGKMLKKATHPEFDLRRSYVPMVTDPSASSWCSLASYPSSLPCFLPCSYSCHPDYPVCLYICSALTSLPQLHLLFTALPYASICFDCKGSISLLLAPMLSYKGIAPETVLGWRLGFGDEIIQEFTCITIYLKCTWNSDFFFLPEVCILARFGWEGKLKTDPVANQTLLLSFNSCSKMKHCSLG